MGTMKWLKLILKLIRESKALSMSFPTTKGAFRDCLMATL